MAAIKEVAQLQQDISDTYKAKKDEYSKLLLDLQKSYNKKQVTMITKLRFLGDEVKLLQNMNETYGVNNSK